MNNIGILTWHNHGNCGGSLQAYALQYYLRNELKVNAEIINYAGYGREKYHGMKQLLKRMIARVLSRSRANGKSRYSYPYALFEHDNMMLKKYLPTYELLKSSSHKYQTIICGSDQIWAPNVFKPEYMLDFCSSKKLSYAASIGLNDIPDTLVPVYKTLLSEFSYVSVREESGRKLLKEKCGIDADVVLDPTFLLNRSHYLKIERLIPDYQDQDYIFCYFLNEKNNYLPTVLEFAQKKGLKIVGYSRKSSDYRFMDNYHYLGPREFLWFVDHSKYVFTDSYHGTIFSLIFHKDFYVFERFDNSDPLNQNSRIYQLDKMFCIKDRIVFHQELYTDISFDYDEFEKRLDVFRSESYEFLREALN